MSCAICMSGASTRDVILPMLRRLDAVIEGTKQAVLDMKAVLDEAGVIEQDKCSAGGGGTGVLLPRVRSPHPVATISGNLVRD